MRRRSLLIAFLLCIDQVACLEAVGVLNQSSIFNNNPSKNWVVLAAGTNTWDEYRHQADIFHAYQLVRKNKVPAENIITFAYDDIAYHPRYISRAIFAIWYQLYCRYALRCLALTLLIFVPYFSWIYDVTRENFVKVLKGDQKLAANKKKVLKSGPDDNVFIFYSGHGLKSLITFIKQDLYAMELNDTLAYMHSNRMYNKLVLYVEACDSGSMFRDILPSNMGIYVTTSANEDEKSWGVFCDDKDIEICLANEYSYAWITDSEYKDIKKRTLEQQYEEVKKRTKDSHVMKYGEMAMGSLPLGKFQGHFDLLMHGNDGAIPPNAVDRKPSFQAHFFSKSRRLMEAATEKVRETAWRKLHHALQVCISFFEFTIKYHFSIGFIFVVGNFHQGCMGAGKRHQFNISAAVSGSYAKIQRPRGSSARNSSNGAMQSRIRGRNPHRLCPQHLFLRGTHRLVCLANFPYCVLSSLQDMCCVFP
ncbi:hypothetical protein T265_15659 [Opisthorchis viverrini]|uniref:Peptidase C13 family protein n=1 Tax=Opisthorchis viverrini TaxID=6198 RepID=A0A074ZV95_OPIVI|nr:hypothetical protein T265_15659 [Opisthorchis viverrini]KER19104.1 hypothetical protein T265_15659 [Opisthorchis viverrini]